MHYVYMVECCDGSLYTGYTTDPIRRLDEHNHKKSGAKYTRVRRPVVLKYTEVFDTKSAACKREAEIKKLTRLKKLQLIEAHIENSK